MNKILEMEKERFFMHYNISDFGGSSKDYYDYKISLNRFVDEISPKLRKATKMEYKEWLHGWIKNGGRIQAYNREFDSARIYIAKESLTIFPMYGSSSFELIIPKGIQISIEENSGHIQLYYMEGFKTNYNVGYIYNDI